MRSSDYVVHIVLSVILIVGVYQFYFFCQRHPMRPSRELKMRIDDWIPYRPGWVWYYPVLPIGYATFWWGGMPYYYWNNLYYTWNPGYNGYVVTDPPPTAGSDEGGFVTLVGF